MRRLLRQGAVFYAPNGRELRSFRDVYNAWLLFRRLCFRRKYSRRLWEIQPSGEVTELF